MIHTFAQHKSSEPNIEELMEDDIFQKLMHRDGVNPNAVRSMRMQILEQRRGMPVRNAGQSR